MWQLCTCAPIEPAVQHASQAVRKKSQYTDQCGNSRDNDER